MPASTNTPRYDEQGLTVTPSRDEHIAHLRKILGDTTVQRLLKSSSGCGWGGPANE
jgi:hypothetical protein